jgi:uncharacterized protein HemX
MSESVNTPTAPRKASGWSGLLYAIAALILLGGALAWLLTRDSAAPALASAGASAAPAIDPTAGMASLENRLNDAQEVNRLLREQALAMSQRMDLVEQSLAAMRRDAAPSSESFKLDEAQYLLGLAETRLELFADPQSAAQALSLADHLLAGMGNPTLAGVRQTLSIELDVIKAAPLNDMPALSGRLRELKTALGGVPIRSDVPESARGRLSNVLDRYLVVRRDGEAMPVLGRSAWAVREGLTIEFERAQLALERQQPQTWQDALSTALGMAERGVNAQDAVGERFLGQLRALSTTALAPAPPKIGQTLRALRRLRDGNVVDSPLATDQARDLPAPDATSLAEQATRQTSLAEQATRQTSLAEQATRQTSAAPYDTPALLPAPAGAPDTTSPIAPQAPTTPPAEMPPETPAPPALPPAPQTGVN